MATPSRRNRENHAFPQNTAPPLPRDLYQALNMEPTTHSALQTDPQGEVGSNNDNAFDVPKNAHETYPQPFRRA